MKALHMVAFILLVVGGLNWLLFAVVGWDISYFLGGMDSMFAKIIYGLVGLSAIYLIFMHPKECKVCMGEGKPSAM
jgi:hypothetical protein